MFLKCRTRPPSEFPSSSWSSCAVDWLLDWSDQRRSHNSRSFDRLIDWLIDCRGWNADFLTRSFSAKFQFCLGRTKSIYDNPNRNGLGKAGCYGYGRGNHHGLRPVGSHFLPNGRRFAGQWRMYLNHLVFLLLWGGGEYLSEKCGWSNVFNHVRCGMPFSRLIRGKSCLRYRGPIEFHTGAAIVTVSLSPPRFILSASANRRCAVSSGIISPQQPASVVIHRGGGGGELQSRRAIFVAVAWSVVDAPYSLPWRGQLWGLWSRGNQERCRRI